MSREAFKDSAHCTYNSRCKTCRNAGQKGHDFRKSLVSIVDLPDGNVNFDCPWGFPWLEGEKPAFEKAEIPVTPPVVTDGTPAPAPKPLTPGKPCGCGQRTIQSMVTAPDGTQSPTSIRLPSPEFMANIPRSQCPDCTRKHIAQAILTLQESIDGHLEHRWLAIGHLAEAVAEIRQLFPDIATRLEDTYRQMMKEQDFIPDLMPLILEISQKIAEVKARAVTGVQGP